MNVADKRVPGLSHVGRLPLRDVHGHAADACLIRFSLADYDVTAFEAAGIACPLQIRRSVPKRQAEYLFGRLAARHALQALGSTTLDLPSGSHRQPIWPPGISGSITHSQGYAAALALPRSQLAGVGLDIEGIAAGSTLEALLATAVDAGELERMHAFEGACPLPVLATLLFSAKEAFFKAAFADVGRYFDFTAVRLGDVDLARGHLVLQVREPLTADLAPGAERTVSFGFLDAGTIYTACLW